MTFADACAICGAPIDVAADAALLRDSTAEGTDAGSVEYRHTGCDPADAPRDLSTVIDL